MRKTYEFLMFFKIIESFVYFSDKFKHLWLIFTKKVKNYFISIIKSEKPLFLNKKKFGQNFVFLAHSVKPNPAKFIICSILKRYGSKLCKIWANKLSKTLNLLINSLKNTTMGRFLKNGSIDFFQNTLVLISGMSLIN